MDIVGITFDGPLKEYLTIKALKVSKWIDTRNLPLDTDNSSLEPSDPSLDAIFRLTIEHKYGEGGFRKLKDIYIYFREEDLENIIIEPDVIIKEREILQKSQSGRSREHKLEERISPLEGYIPPILTERLIKEDDGKRKRIRVILRDYKINEEITKRNILFSLRFKKSISLFDNVRPITEEIPWTYDRMIEPYLVQTLKWNKEEFMPPIESLEVWLQIPKRLYSSLSAIDIQPVSHLEQMFFLGEEIAERFRKAKQPLAQEDTLCINWIFPNVSISSPPEEITVIHRPRPFREEELLIKRFEKDREDYILILKEILYMCKIRTLDFNYIISGISDENLKKVLQVFNTMVFQRNLRPMRDSLNMLLPLLEYFRDLPYNEELLTRYDTFYTLISCNKSRDFFSEQIFSKIRQIQKLKDILDPDYIELMQDFSILAELTRKFSLYRMDEDKPRYKNEILSFIDNLDHKWSGRLTHPDRHILIYILANWKQIVEKEFEEQLPKPKIEATIKTQHLALADMVGIVLSIKNTGEGEARDVQAKLFQSDDYDIITEESEIKTCLIGGGRAFEPELIIKPKNVKKAVISGEIFYKDTMGREMKIHLEESIKFVKKQIPFQKIENPYIIGGIVKESKMFYGREEFLSDIIDNFRGKYQINPIFLYGQKRTGKTSILFQLKRKLKDKFAPVLFTTLEVFGKKSFYVDLMEKIKKELEITDIEIPNVEEDPFDFFKDEFYASIKQRLGGKELILMIDEYQRIDEFITEGYYDDSVIDFLNALVHDGEIKFILAGFLQPDELKNSKWVKLMKIFTTMNVSFLSRDNAEKLICEPVRGQMEYDEGGIEKIMSLSGFHPYFIQLICHTMVEYHNHNRVNLIGYTNVAKHLFEYFEKGRNVFWDSIGQMQEIEKRILFYMYDFMEKKRMACVHRAEIEVNLMDHREETGRTEIERALSYLERREIIRKSAEHPDYYEFTIDLYRHWVKWNIPQE